VRDLAGGPRRFVELQRVLPGISTEQLRSRLNRMVADGLLTRQRYREVPPRVDYELTERARDLMPVLGALAAWGYEWAWGPPRDGEAVDIGAILRLAPGLVVLPSSTSGTVACTVTDSDRAHDHLLTVDRGRVSIEEREAPDADAQVSGSQERWVEALAPNGSVDALSLSGERRLAEALLTALRSEADGRAAAAA
jgi:DNA-binding HxlR family transcriptional regulator